jgi:hypothetical protein
MRSAVSSGGGPIMTRSVSVKEQATKKRATKKRRTLSAPVKVTNAEKIFSRDQRKNRQSSYSICRFSDDLEKCLNEELAVDDKCTRPDEDSSLPKKEGNNVHFSDVTIREYRLIVGDNIVSKGVPLTLAWESVSSVSINLDKYEQARKDHCRKHLEMHMTYLHREKILRKLGFSRKDIDYGIKAANIARRKRRETHANLHASHTHERLETLQKDLKIL